MAGASILIVFFSIFTAASLFAPFQMFPGNFLSNLIGPAVSEYAQYLSAAFNGLFYGVLTWLVFAGISRKLQQER